jgi:hypothetical protein
VDLRGSTLTKSRRAAGRGSSGRRIAGDAAPADGRDVTTHARDVIDVFTMLLQGVAVVGAYGVAASGAMGRA